MGRRRIKGRKSKGNPSMTSRSWVPNGHAKPSPISLWSVFPSPPPMRYTASLPPPQSSSAHLILPIFFFLILLLPNPLLGRTRCVRAMGRVVCPTDPDSHFNVEVNLMDSDTLPWETDDLMGKASTDLLGNYTVQGCADDFGAWNDPDPYILITHRCPELGHDISVVKRKHRIPIERKYLPEEIEVATTRLDLD